STARRNLSPPLGVTRCRYRHDALALWQIRRKKKVKTAIGVSDLPSVPNDQLGPDQRSITSIEDLAPETQHLWTHRDVGHLGVQGDMGVSLGEFESVGVEAHRNGAAALVNR